MAEKVVELHAIIHGYVQGVGYRFVTERIARRLGITGTVKNLANGTVEVYAQGSRDFLDQMVHQLKNAAGRVDDIKVEFREPQEIFEDFRIAF